MMTRNKPEIRRGMVAVVIVTQINSAEKTLENGVLSIAVVI